MKAVLQRVTHASVKVDGEIKGKIGNGLLVFLGVGLEDTEKDVIKFVNKIVKLRIFSDENDKINLSVNDVNGSLLVISQFTLYADCRKGNRPNFINAGKPDKAEQLYELFISECKKNASKTAVTNKTSETAASTADSFPCCASLFFANAYLYLFAINFSPQVIADKKKQISKSRPCCIQYHIIYVKAPNLCNKLDDLYRNTKPKSCQYDQPSASHFVQNNRQYKSKWKKTNYISKKICNYRHKSKLFSVYPETPYLNKRYQIISVLSFFHCCSSVFF